MRNKIGIVSQKIYLFKGSIEENIKYGVEDVSDFEVERVIDMLSLEQLFASLPNRKNTLVEENGLNLSGGQIQRIVIARAFLKKPEIFLFDEATAHIDYESKIELEKIILTHLKEKICIFITHEMSLITL
ncbi:hypothetical protein IGI37_000930 [Enterococcus sp. AZ194]